MIFYIAQGYLFAKNVFAVALQLGRIGMRPYQIQVAGHPYARRTPNA
jgi:hypothetical protein